MATAVRALDRSGLKWIALAPLLVGAGWAVSFLSRATGDLAIFVVPAIALVPAVTIVYLTRPHIVLSLYLFALPLLMGGFTTFINLGEIATLFVLGIGVPTLVLVRARVDRDVAHVAWLLVALGVLGCISLVMNSILSPADIMNGAFKYLSFAAILVLVYVRADTEAKARGMARAIGISGAVVAIYSLVDYFSGNSYYPEYGYSRASGTFEHWNQLGGYLALVSFLLLSLALAARNTFLRLAGFAGYVAQLLALLLTLTLGSVMGVFASLFYAIVGIFKRSFGKALLGTLATLVVFAVLWQAVPQVGEKFSIADERVGDRLVTYERGVQLLKENFWWGYGSADEVYQAVLEAAPRGGIQATSAVPHNLFLSMSVEKGIFGGLLLLLIVIRVFRLLWRRPGRAYGRDAAIHYGILLGILAFIVQDMSNLLILHSRLGVIFFAMVALDVRLREFGEAREQAAASTSSRPLPAPLREPLPPAVPTS